MPYKFKPLPSPEELWDLFALSPLTGELFWRIKPRNKSRSTNGRAGCIWHNGYIKLTVKGTAYMAHRIVRAWVDGKDPGNTPLDHADQNKLNNQPWNIRICTHTQNQANIRGRKGYFFHAKRNKYRAAYVYNKKSFFVGYFDTAEEANAAYIEAKRRIFGEFAP